MSPIEASTVEATTELTPGIVISLSALDRRAPAAPATLSISASWLETRSSSYTSRPRMARSSVGEWQAVQPFLAGLTEEMTLVGRDQVGVKDRFHPALDPDELLQDARPLGGLASATVACPRRRPIPRAESPTACSLAKVAASTLSVFTRAWAIAFTSRGLAIATRLTWGRRRRSTAALLPVASRTTSSSRLSVFANATSGSWTSSTRNCLRDLAIFEDCHLGEGSMDVHTDDSHAASPFFREPVACTTSTDPRSQRSRASRRGGQVTTRARSSS